MFEKFSERAIRAVLMAQEEAQRLGQDRVGTEMLVVGVVAEGSELGGQVLRKMGVDLSQAREELENLMGRGDSVSSCAENIPFTIASKQALEDTIKCARSMGSPAADTSHLLLAVLEQEKGTGSMLLGRLCNIQSPKTLKDEVLRILVAQQVARRGGSVQGYGLSGKAADDINLTATLRYGKDLTLMARRGQLDPLVGREEQLKRTIRILGRRSKNNPVLVGKAGVGKTSIFHGLAQRVADGQVPEILRGRRVVQLDLAMLLAGTRYRGDFEERLKDVIREVADSQRRVILVIDEVHVLVGAGGTGSSEGGVGIDAANLLKPALASGELQCIGATTPDEYRARIERDPALERRFQPVHVPEPSHEEAEQIIEGLAPVYAGHHNVHYSPAAIRAAVRLSAQYVSGRQLPDKAVDVLDEAGSAVRQEASREELVAAPAGAEDVQDGSSGAAVVPAAEQEQARRFLAAEATAFSEKRRALEAEGEHDQEIRWLEAREAEIREDLWRMETEAAVATATTSSSKGSVAVVEVSESDIAEVISGWTGIPVVRVGAEESQRLLKLEAELQQSIIGQDEAVQGISKALRRARAGLRDPQRPIASFFFCGPTGVGKTKLTKELATSYFGSEDATIRFDMSEFMEKHTVSKLIGAPPGYVGYSEGGSLAEAIRRQPYALVLFDEIEKAHPDVFNILLQVLDDGRLSDARGQTVSFANTLIVMTSNVGSRQVQRGIAGSGTLGFGTPPQKGASEEKQDVVRELVLDEMKATFRPEFLGRIDEVVVFRALAQEDVQQIAELEFAKVINRLKARNVKLRLTKAAKAKIVEEGYDATFGARVLRRAVVRFLEDPVAEHLLAESALAGDSTDTSTPQAALEDQQLVVDVDRDGQIEVRPDDSV